MYNKIKKLLVTYREQLLYLVFGGLTTVVDWSISFVLYALWSNSIAQNTYLIHAVNMLAWTAAVLFAFFTNRKWVFGSSKRGFLPIFSEFCGFMGGRIFTLLLQEAIFFLFFDLLSANEYLIKISAAVLVVVLNYLISRFLIFRKKKTTNSNQRRPT